MERETYKGGSFAATKIIVTAGYQHRIKKPAPPGPVEFCRQSKGLARLRYPLIERVICYNNRYPLIGDTALEPYDDPGAHRDPFIKVLNVILGKADAT